MAPVAQRTPLSPGAKKGLIIGGVALGVVILAAIGLTVVKSTLFSPQATVNSLMSALDQGRAVDAGKAMGLSADNNPLINDAIYKAASGRPTNAKITSSTENGSSATVRVTFQMDGESQDATLQLTKKGTDWLIIDHWQVDDSDLASTLSVSVPSSGGTRDLLVNGQAAGTVDPSGTTTLAALPGQYKVAIGGTELFNEESEDWNSIPGAYVNSVSFNGEISTQFQQKVTQAVHDKLTACTTSRSSDCPYVFTNSSYSNFKITTQPTISVSTSYFGSGFRYSTTSYGSVNYTYTYYDGTTTTDDSLLYPYGSVTVNGNSVTVTFG